VKILRTILASLIALAIAVVPARPNLQGTYQPLLLAQRDGSCTESRAFFIRAPGLDNTHFAAYDALICGLVTDGVFPLLDVLQIYATQDLSTAELNLISSSYSATQPGGGSTFLFTVDRGFTGVAGQTCEYLDVGFNASTASSPNYVQNSAHISAWSVVDAGAQNLALMGNISGGDTLIYPQWIDNNAYYRVNATGPSVAAASPVGHYLANRSDSVNIQGYRNAVSVVTSNASTSSPVPTGNFTVGITAAGCGGTGNPQEVAMISIGRSQTPTQVTNFYNRLRTYMTTVGVP
jgi:hypothetical protein